MDVLITQAPEPTVLAQSPKEKKDLNVMWWSIMQ